MSGLYHHMADRDPPALSLLIAAPEPPTFLLLDDEFLTSGYCEVSGSVGSLSGSCLTIWNQLADLLRDPAAFCSLVGTPNPNACGIVLPGFGSFANGKSFARFDSNRVNKLCLIILY